MYSPEIWVGVCGPSLKTLTLFQTKICDLLCHISDLTQNSKPHFRPAPYPISSALKHLRTSLNSRPIIKSHLSEEEN